jgi:adenine-specific DNA-methyltransferase
LVCPNWTGDRPRPRYRCGRALGSRVRTTSGSRRTFLEQNDETEEDLVTNFVYVEEWPGVETVHNAIDGGSVTGQTSWGHVNRIHQAELSPDEKWTSLFDPIDIESVSELVTLESIAGEIKRGIATGDNDFFCLTASEADEWNVDTEYLAPIVRSASAAEHPDYTRRDRETQREDDEEVYLLYHLDVWKPELQSDPVWEYIEQGVETGTDQSYLARNRNPWYLVDRRPVPDILFKYMSRGGGRFVYNDAGVRNLNNLHGITLAADFEREDVDALLAYLHSSYADKILKRDGRTYVGGLSKVEPNELKEIPVLDPRELDSSDRTELANKFRELCDASRHDAESTSSVTAEIDATLSRVIDTN